MKHGTDFTKVKPGACVAFGRFDGLHIGHRAVIQKVCEQRGRQRVLLSFSEGKLPFLYTEYEKAYLLKNSGLDLLVSIPAEKVLPLPAEAFAKEILQEKMNAGTVVAGEGARFGSDRLDLPAFRALGERYGFDVVMVPMVRLFEEAVSTGAVKEAILKGDFQGIQKLLGHAYLLCGTVVHGKAAGRKFGMPTANLRVAENKMFPPHGVYGSNSAIDGENFRSMTNVGLRPSDDDIPIATIETFLLDFDRNIYGKEVFLELLVYIRGVVKFPGGLAELRKQIDKDIEAVKGYMRDKAEG